MSVFSIEIANTVIAVDSIYEETFIFCKDFLCNKEPNFRLVISQEDIENEKKITSSFNFSHPDDRSVEISALLRKVSDEIVEYGAFLFHGAAISYSGKGIIFTGNSGIGKSTHMFKWLLNMHDVTEINGDKPFVIPGSNPLVCGSPWGGKERICVNEQVPLKAIILLERSENNTITKVSFSEIFPALCQQTYRPSSEENAKKTFRLLKSLSKGLSFWRFKCNNFKDDCFDVVYDALSANNIIP